MRICSVAVPPADGWFCGAVNLDSIEALKSSRTILINLRSLEQTKDSLSAQQEDVLNISLRLLLNNKNLT